MAFTSEKEFEDALIKVLTESFGWEKTVLEYKTEKELLENWKNILYDNNRQIDRLDEYLLTDGEMQQIIEQIVALRTPLKLNGFINGRTISVTRDNPDDKAHFGKEISLKIYDRQEIAAGQSRYQIARQPIFSAKTDILPDRRGDFILLINGMPVIHVELKKSGIPISQACHQIEKYTHEGVFTNLFALVQVFVAMNPEDAVYFANPGPDGKFNEDYYFHWADFNNDAIRDWKTIASKLLSIPMAHQLIGFYTVADDTDSTLKVMRSYQYYAANMIADTVSKHNWEQKNQRGGYIWHTTGSGKTMTSFKSAQLIATSKDADKVVFLIDRIELGTQSAGEYRGFADETDDIQETEDTMALIHKLKSTDPSDTLIVTSVQKLSNIKQDTEGRLKQADLDIITSKRIVFIVDECHRSTFGDMMNDIKSTFEKSLFFGFSGTPIHIENRKKGCTTADVFGNELHRYSIADGIRDENVLGFDCYKVLTFKEKDMREAVALEQAKADSLDAVFQDKSKEKIYYKFMRDVPMASITGPDGTVERGIEYYLSKNGQYRTEEHQKMVVDDILENWIPISANYKFHAIFATSSITEACEYYRLFKKNAPKLKVTALFDPSIDNNAGAIAKEDALVELVEDYNERYHQTFSIPTWGNMKKDIQNRLSHKRPYERIEMDRDEQIDLLIVVDQMLTGYDSKWLNALYLDKILKFENVIQAFSRTNRLFGEDKTFGTIKYYRAPFTMERNVEEAVKAYSGDKPFGMFVDKLDKNIENMNAVFAQIKNLFAQSGVSDFMSLPPDVLERKMFVSLFNQFNGYLNAAKIQGFEWGKTEYKIDSMSGGVVSENELKHYDEMTAQVNEFPTAPDMTQELVAEDSNIAGFLSNASALDTEVVGLSDGVRTVSVSFDENVYNSLVQRYKEIRTDGEKPPVKPTNDLPEEVPYDIEGYITTIDTDQINAEYMNSRFEIFKKALTNGNPEDVRATKEELHKTFAMLTQEEQKFANLFLHDIDNGDVTIEDGKTLRDYINEYMSRAKNDQIHQFAEALGMDEELLREMMSLKMDDVTINEYGRFDKLKATVDRAKARECLEAIEGDKLSIPKLNARIDTLIRRFIIFGGFSIENAKD